MAPGKAEAIERPHKRPRNNPTDDRYAEIEAVQRAQRLGDALSTPALSDALDKLVKSRQTSAVSKKKVENALKLVKNALDNLPKDKTLQYDSATTRKTLRKVAKGVDISSLFRSDCIQELSVMCAPPQKVNVIGSFLLGYSANKEADVSVEIPSEIFKPKDHINYRYHDKRLLYLVYLARYLLKAGEENWSTMSLLNSHLNGDPAKPVLRVSHSEEPSVTIRLIPSIADDVFEAKYLAEDRKNLREAGESSLVDDPLEATAAYNSSIAMDSTFVAALQNLYTTSKGIAAFAQSVTLLSSWSVRNRLGVGNFIMACVLSELISKGTIPARAGREHLLRCAWRVISAGILKELRICNVRLCVGMDAGLMIRCERAAADALHVIESKTAAEDPWFGILPSLFVTARGSKCIPKPLSTLFDGFVRIAWKENNEKPDIQKILSVMKRTVVDTHRVSSMEVISEDLIGLQLCSADDLYRRVDTRPEDWSEGSFKKFWGGKAGLRRFKDGRIVESLVWKGGLGTLQEMLEYTFHHHLNNLVTVKVIIGDLESASKLEIPDEDSSRAISAFNELASMLRSLEGLPLKIRAVHATAPHLRRCGPLPIRPNGTRCYTEPLDIIASFESSSAWPDDPVAISAGKAAFYVALKTTLASKGLESKVTISFVDISLGGFVFRLRIRVDKEKRMLAPHSPESEALIWETESRVEHHDKIKHVGNPLIGSVVRLSKQWLNTHLLLCQMGPRGEELVEVLVAGIMAKTNLSQRKTTMGYFCQFVHLLAEFPWEVCPLAVLLMDEDGVSNESRDIEYFQLLNSSLEQYASGAHGEPFFAVYHTWDEQKENADTCFGKGYNPGRVIAERIVATARSSLAFIDAHLVNPSSAPSLESIFSTPTDAFDIILSIHKHMTPYRKGSNPFGRKAGPIVGLDPVTRLHTELENALGMYALFLMERGSRAKIFVVWRPKIEETFKFALKAAPFTTPKDGRLVPNKDEIIGEMRRIGHGLISDVQIFGDGNS